MQAGYILLLFWALCSNRCGSVRRGHCNAGLLEFVQEVIPERPRIERQKSFGFRSLGKRGIVSRGNLAG